MSKKDFFRILLKAIGINLIIGVIIGAVPIFFMLFVNEFAFAGLIPFVGLVIFGFVVHHFLILKTDTLINAFNLDSGFDDDTINLVNFDFQKMVQLGLIIVGLYWLTTIVSELLSLIQILVQGLYGSSYVTIFTTLIQFGLAIGILIKSKDLAKVISK